MLFCNGFVENKPTTAELGWLRGVGVTAMCPSRLLRSNGRYEVIYLWIRRSFGVLNPDRAASSGPALTDVTEWLFQGTPAPLCT
jgi:hypothetical protein